MTKNGFDWTSVTTAAAGGGSNAAVSQADTTGQKSGSSFMDGGFWGKLLSIGDAPEGSEVKQTVDINAILAGAVSNKSKTSPIYIIIGALFLVAIIVAGIIIYKKSKS